jgi:hypothetical protein
MKKYSLLQNKLLQASTKYIWRDIWGVPQPTQMRDGDKHVMVSLSK